MAYSAALVLHAQRPVPLRIGRWNYQARPLSAALVLRALETLRTGTAAEQAAVTWALLRAAFPRPAWWHVRARWRDPVRRLLQLPEPVRSEVVTALIRRLLETPLASTTETDPYAEQRRAERAAVYGAEQAAEPGPTFAVALQSCRMAFGETWYRSPHWPTVDQIVPHAVVWAEYAGLLAQRAQLQLEQVMVHAVVHAKRPETHLRKLRRAAYPGDPVMAGPH